MSEHSSVGKVNSVFLVFGINEKKRLFSCHDQSEQIRALSVDFRPYCTHSTLLGVSCRIYYQAWPEDQPSACSHG